MQAFVREVEGDLAVLEAFADMAQLVADDAPQILAGQGLENHDLAQAIEEFRAEMIAHRLQYRFLGAFAQLATAGDAVEQMLGSQIGGEDDHRIAEVHDPSLAICQPPLIEHLQEGVPHLRIGLLDLVEQDHRVGIAAHGLGQLAALVIADVAGRRADEPGDAVALHVFGHVDAHHLAFVVEQLGGQGLGQLGLADAGRPEEEERALRLVGIAQSGARAHDGVGDRVDRFILADDAFVQPFGQRQQPRAIAFGQFGRRDPGPA